MKLILLALLTANGLVAIHAPQAGDENERRAKAANPKNETAGHSQIPLPAATILARQIVSVEPSEQNEQGKTGESARPLHDWIDKLNAVSTAVVALFAIVTAFVVYRQLETMRAEFDQIADVRWSIKGHPAEDGICHIQASVVNLSDRPMTIIDAHIAIQGQAAKSIPVGTVIDSNAEHRLNFDVPMTTDQLWKFSPTVEWSVSHQHKITKRQVPRRLIGKLHFWKNGEEGQWGTSFEPRGGDDPATSAPSVSGPDPTT